jgi:hypothetical protein
MKTFYLIYQAGIANVFEEIKGVYSLLMQREFAIAESFCRGLIKAGLPVKVGWCNRAGDILLFKHEWMFDNFDLAPFSVHFAKDFVPVDEFSQSVDEFYNEGTEPNVIKLED